MEVLKVGETDYPFGLTARGRLNIEGSKVNLDKVAKSEQEALRFAWEICRGACIFAETAFKFDFNAFVNKVEAEVFAKARTLAVELLAKATAEASVKKANDKTKK